MSTENPAIELALVLPVYNEEGALEEVISDWVQCLRNLNIAFQIHAYNDGSRDGSLALLQKLSEGFPELQVHDKSNSGHGPTILLGYRQLSNIPWLFQVDSDNELRAAEFAPFWNQRESFDLLIAKRSQWSQPLPRKVVSWVSRTVIQVFYGTPVWDVNAPFRLMRTEVFAPLFAQIPEDTFAPNLILSGFAGLGKVRVFQTPVQHISRSSGEVSIKKWKLLQVAMRSFWQSIVFRFQVKV